MKRRDCLGALGALSTAALLAGCKTAAPTTSAPASTALPGEAG